MQILSNSQIIILLRKNSSGIVSPAALLMVILASFSLLKPAQVWVRARSLPVYSPPIDAWRIDCVECNGAIGKDGSLAMDAQGRLHIAYSDAERPGLTYAFQVQGGWYLQTLPDILATDFSMALDGQAYPHFCHYDDGLSYTFQDGAGWHTTILDPNGVGQGGIYEPSCSIAVDSQNNPHIIYYASAFHDDGYRYTYRDAAGWHPMYLPYFGPYDLAVDKEGYAHLIVITDSLIHFRQGANGWSETSIISGAFQYASLALDSGGYPHVSFYDFTAGDLYYAHLDTNGWHTENVDAEGDPGKYSDIAVDEHGFPHISYHDNAYPLTGNLKYASQDDEGWHLQTVDASYNTGFSTSIVLDKSGKPFITYHNESKGDLMLAYQLTQVVRLPVVMHNYQLSPRLELHLDEAIGAVTFADSSAWDHHASCITPACPTAGVEGIHDTALQFDGVNDSLMLGNPPGLNFTGKVTLEAWVLLQSTVGIQNILAHGFTIDPTREMFLRVNNGSYQVGSWDGTGYSTSYPIPAEDVGTWVHLAGVYDGTSWRLYRNGVQVSQSDQPQGAVRVEESWAVGSDGSGSERFFAGRVDEVGIYARALSVEEIWGYYRSVFP